MVNYAILTMIGREKLHFRVAWSQKWARDQGQAPAYLSTGHNRLPYRLLTGYHGYQMVTVNRGYDRHQIKRGRLQLHCKAFSRELEKSRHFWAIWAIF